MPESGMTTEGKRYLMDVMFRGVQPNLELWAGVARRVAGEISLAVVSLAEPDMGYTRQSVFPLDWESLEEGGVRSRSIVFENTGGDVWHSLEVAFIATTRGNDGVVLAWARIVPPQTVLPGNRLEVPFTVAFP